MASRPPLQKKLRRLRKLASRLPLPAYIDAVQWLLDRGYANTRRQARLMLADGKLLADSHVVGRTKAVYRGPTGEPVERWEPLQYIPANLRSSLRVEQ